MSSDSDLVALDEAIGDIDWRALPDGAERGWLDAPSGRLATLSMGEHHGHARHVRLEPSAGPGTPSRRGCEPA